MRSVVSEPQRTPRTQRARRMAPERPRYPPCPLWLMQSTIAQVSIGESVTIRGCALMQRAYTTSLAVATIVRRAVDWQQAERAQLAHRLLERARAERHEAA